MPEALRDGRLAVDFGTTHTVAVLAPAKPLLFDASPLLSSAVAIETGRLLTGRDAVRTDRWFAAHRIVRLSGKRRVHQRRHCDVRYR